jgi:hypothetical protein
MWGYPAEEKDLDQYNEQAGYDSKIFILLIGLEIYFLWICLIVLIVTFFVRLILKIMGAGPKVSICRRKIIDF